MDEDMKPPDRVAAGKKIFCNVSPYKLIDIDQRVGPYLSQCQFEQIRRGPLRRCYIPNYFNP